ncbi:MAG: GNAT family N-acetyltransferase [Syntrophobacteraceae bacterium]
MFDFSAIPGIEPDVGTLPSGERVCVHLFRPQDAPGIARLFRKVYGDGYPVRHFYEPEALAAALKAGANYSIVARKEDGEVIGHVGVFRSSPYPNLYEAGAGLVDPGYRSAGINLLMLHHAYERLAPALGLEEMWGESVCYHLHMQKALEHHRHVETGLEVDLMPAEAYAREKSAPGRVTSLLSFRAYRSGPHRVFLPPAYEDALRFLYSGLDDGRTLEPSRGLPPGGTKSEVSLEVFDSARVCRIAFPAIGEDFGPCLGALEREAVPADTVVAQVTVNLSCPWAGHAVDILRGRGYFLGGILPRWFGEDGLLMQKIAGRPNWEGIQLLSERSGEILRIVRNDWERLCGSSAAGA